MASACAKGQVPDKSVEKVRDKSVEKVQHRTHSTQYPAMDCDLMELLFSLGHRLGRSSEEVGYIAMILAEHGFTSREAAMGLDESALVKEVPLRLFQASAHLLWSLREELQGGEPSTPKSATRSEPLTVKSATRSEPLTVEPQATHKAHHAQDRPKQQQAQGREQKQCDVNHTRVSPSRIERWDDSRIDTSLDSRVSRVLNPPCVPNKRAEPQRPRATAEPLGQGRSPSPRRTAGTRFLPGDVLTSIRTSWPNSPTSPRPSSGFPDASSFPDASIVIDGMDDKYGKPANGEANPWLVGG